MAEFLNSPMASIVMWIAILAVLVAFAIYLVGRFRGSTGEAQRPTHELITNFREWHSQGDLDDEEYRTIKTLLAAKLQDELKGNGDKA